MALGSWFEDVGSREQLPLMEEGVDQNGRHQIGEGSPSHLATSPTPLVEVLLATYNGERFLREQIESILAQDYGRLCVLARDDGSKDGTRAILEEYVERDPQRFRMLGAGEATGSAKGNFVRLMQASTAPYVCFADQDDVWRTWKLSLQMAKMREMEAKHGPETPLLVFSDLEIVNDRLETLHGSFWKHQRITPERIGQLNRLLTQNVVTGCTALMNRPLVEAGMLMPGESFMHDWWIALMAAVFGAGAFLPQPTVLYRQHGANVLGAVEHARPNLIPKWRWHVMRKRQWDVSERQARAVSRIFEGRLPRHSAEILRAFERCETSPNRVVRTGTLLWHRFLQTGVRGNLATLWYLWDMDRAKRDEAARNIEVQVEG